MSPLDRRAQPSFGVRLAVICGCMLAPSVVGAQTRPAAPSYAPLGSTVFVVLGNEDASVSQPARAAGFESAVSTSDPQRGALEFTFAHISNPGNLPRIPASARYVGRFRPDPASRLSLRGEAGSQLLALLDISTTDEGGAPVSLSPDGEEFRLEVAYVGASETFPIAQDAYRLFLLPGSGPATPNEAYAPGIGTVSQSHIWAELERRLPSPKLRVSFSPGAASLEFDLSYDAAKLQPLDAYREGSAGAEEYVQCSGCAAACSGSSGSQIAQIRAVLGPTGRNTIAVPFLLCGNPAIAIDPGDPATVSVSTGTASDAAGFSVAPGLAIDAVAY